MSLLYDLLLPLGVIAAAPAYLARSLRHPEYRAHLGERFGHLPSALASRIAELPRRPAWIQAVSVGEVMLARTLIAGLAREGSAAPLVVSSTTPAGRNTALSLTSLGVEGVFHFPIDWPPFVRRALEAIKPSVFICIETEIWPNLLAQCGRRRVPVLLVNGRISKRSEAGYRLLKGLLRGPLRAVSLACMQSGADAGRARSIGVPPERIVVTGNMKFDMSPPGEGVIQDLRALYGISSPAAPVLVAGSTSPGEEDLVLEAVEACGIKDLLLILAPRHRERFEEVAKILHRRGVPFVRRTQLPSGRPRRAILLDTLGELGRSYALASVAFVGGSLVPRGGQNLIEPAASGVPVIFGPHTDNFAAVASALLNAGAGFRVSGAADLAATLRRLLEDPARRLAAGAAGRDLAEAHRGATDRTVHHILPFLG